MKKYKKHVKQAVMISIMIVMSFGLMQCLGNFSERREMKLVNKEKKELQQQIAKRQAEIALIPTPTPTPERFGDTLEPGEKSPKYRTNGSHFQYRFYGTMKMHLYRSEDVYETLLARNGSYEIKIDNRSVVPELMYVQFERPDQTDTPLAFTIDIYPK